MNTSLHWIAFNLFVLLAVALDLAVFHRRARKDTLRESLAWTLIWIAVAIAFGFAILRLYGKQSTLEYFTGYIIEKALSMDNLFVFLVIFRVFAVKEEVQHRLLAWGILGALLMRGAMIAAGTALLQRFDWIMYLFGAFIIYAGVHMLVRGETVSHPEKNFLVRYFSKRLPLTPDYRGANFFVRESGKLFATPLFLVLLVVEVTDVTFAVDSIPAVFGITRNPFIVYSSNVFAVLGLRALYFLLAGVLERFAYIKFGLAAVLIFVGAKMIAEPWRHIPVSTSLTIVIAILAIAAAASLVVKKRTAGLTEKSSE